MKQTLLEIKKAALALSESEKIELAETVVRSLVSHVSPDVREKQISEVMKRRDDILSGKIDVTAEQVIREIQDLVR